MKRAPKPIVEIVWEDATSTDGWTALDDLMTKGMSRCRSIGYLIGETADFVCISGSIHWPLDHDGNEELEGACSISIPKRTIRERRTIR